MDTFTLVHVFISLIALATGFVVLGGWMCGVVLRGWTGAFLVTTIATNATGFGFPFEKFLPSHGIAILSLVLLAVAAYALYGKRLAGRWRLVYFVTALAALYFNAFVLVVQTFLKFPVLHALAPNQNEPPFAISQGLLLVAIVVAGILAWRRFRVAV